MSEKKFDTQSADPQGTAMKPMNISDFDVERYADYEANLLERNKQFWENETGIAVYRRFRVPEVFTYGCRDMEYSLSLQLAGLRESMNYEADVANFLEPWYGLGATAAAFGVEYEWIEGQAPAVRAPFKTIDEALNYDYVPIEQTNIGRHTLQMIEYFLDKTKGKVPTSPSDVQSPMDTASYLIDINNLLMGVIDNPEGLKKLLDILADLLMEFINKQVEMIGDALVLPGHGFAASRNFGGMGMSDDIIMMLSSRQYAELEVPNMTKVGKAFGGAVFHSCGNWSDRMGAIKEIKNLAMVDAAFSKETDPDPCPPEPFLEGFRDSGIAVNARVVGDVDTVLEKARRLWRPGMKLIMVTYCKTPQEQREAYKQIHGLY